MNLATVLLGVLICGHLLAEEGISQDAEPRPITPNGVAWYSTWGTALAEAKRSQRPIFFMATPSQREGVPGVFSAAYARTKRDLIDAPEFVEISRSFVCVRLATLERPEHLEMVRFLLPQEPAARPPLSAFVVFAPDGQTALLPAKATPFSPGEDAIKARKTLCAKLHSIAEKHPAQAPIAEAVMEDFHSFAQALRTTAADQRLLIFIVAPQGNRMPYWKKAQAIINDPEVLGKIHVDFIGAADSQWPKIIERDTMQAGYFIIKADEFGLSGRMVAELPLMTRSTKIKASLLKAIERNQQETPIRIDAEHLKRGKELGITFESAVPYPNAPGPTATKP